MESAIVTLISKIGNEPLAILFLVFLFIKFIVHILRDYVWPLIMKRPKKIKFDKWATEEKLEREERQKITDNALAEFRQDLQEIKGEIDILSEAVANHDELNISQSMGIFENMVFNARLDPYRRLKALRRLFGLKGNGDAKVEGFNVARENPGDWKKVLALKMKLTVINYNYYRTAIEEINKKILDHGLTYVPDDVNARIIEHEIVDD